MLVCPVTISGAESLAVAFRFAGTSSSRAAAWTASHDLVPAVASVARATATAAIRSSCRSYAWPAQPAAASRSADAQAASCHVQQPCLARPACHAHVEPDAAAATPSMASPPAKPNDAAYWRASAVKCCSTVCIHTPAVLSWASASRCTNSPFTGMQQLRRQQ